MRNLVSVKNTAFGLLFLVPATIVMAWFFNKNNINKENLGSCETPKEAMQKTQDALQLVSENLNTGIKNAYVIQKLPSNHKQ